MDCQQESAPELLGADFVFHVTVARSHSYQSFSANFSFPVSKVSWKISAKSIHVENNSMLSSNKKEMKVNLAMLLIKRLQFCCRFPGVPWITIEKHGKLCCVSL